MNNTFFLRFVTEEKYMDIEVEVGMTDNMEIKFVAEGEPHMDGEPGDLRLKIRTYPHQTFERRGDDLYTNVTLSLQVNNYEHCIAKIWKNVGIVKLKVVKAFFYFAHIFLTIKEKNRFQMAIIFSGRVDGFRHGFQAFGRPQGECEARQDHVARRPNSEEGRRHAQLRRQQSVWHPLHHVRCGVPQGRTVSRRQKETQ